MAYLSTEETSPEGFIHVSVVLYKSTYICMSVFTTSLDDIDRVRRFGVNC